VDHVNVGEIVERTGFQPVDGGFVPPGRTELFRYIPASGPIVLGHDPAAFHPSPELVASYQADATFFARALGREPTADELDIHRYVREQTSPLRTARVGPLLAMVTAVPAQDLVDMFRPGADARQDVQEWLADLGATLPGPDTWEYLYGAGTRTLWPWGDAWDPPTDWPGNLFDLVFDGPHRCEYTSVEFVFCGGTGGWGSDGGDFVELFPLATAYRPPEGEALEESADSFADVRGVIAF